MGDLDASRSSPSILVRTYNRLSGESQSVQRGRLGIELDLLFALFNLCVHRTLHIGCQVCGP